MTLRQLRRVLDGSIWIRLIIDGNESLACHASYLEWIKDYILDKNIVYIKMAPDQIDVLEVSIA